MKKLKTIDFIAILFLTFGITYLDFDNLTFEDNIKAYIQIIIGAIMMIYILYKRGQASKAENE
ncbi:hypothetical protein [Brumimicrobium mesophilum]|uniref:hypothetical protein n=1 Tax=Brumimicrobium mesophilum TaxID=392717 RepID=UPI000D1418F2|nr:hypothetical protein [Brumimicrobium mesophilum]